MGEVTKEQAMRFADYYLNGVTNAERGEPEDHWEEFLRDSGDQGEGSLHQKIDSLQMELREVKAKVATLEGETRTMQKFIKAQQQTPTGRNPE